METADQAHFKPALLAEIFIAYREVGMIYKTTTDAEIKDAILAMKHFLDLALERLLPLDDYFENRLAEVKLPFSE